jgi:hypothetical protein
VELEQFQEDQAVVSEQVILLQLAPLKALMVVLVVDVHQHIHMVVAVAEQQK